MDCFLGDGVAQRQAERCRQLPPRGHFRLQVLIQLGEELLRRQPRLIRTNEDGEVLRHPATLHRLHAHGFERLGEAHHIGRAVEQAAIVQTARPGEDRGDRVGRCRLALLMLAIVAGDGAVRRLRLNRLAIGG